jgi:hypothetical protein
MKYIILILFPLISLANMDITEIMYDPEGTDSGREWIEVYNKSDIDIDISTWKLLENEVNHRISGYEDGSTLIFPNSYAIIADNPSKFLIDYPIYSGILLDSSFALNNTGESLSLIDSEGNQQEYIDYNVEIGGKSGSTISLIGEVYVNGSSTPGIINTLAESVEISSSDIESSHKSQKELTNEKKKINLKIGAGRKRVVTVNTPIEFKVITNTKVGDRKIRWAFGDGHSRSRKKVSHSYEFPGIYNVVVRGEEDDEEAVSRTTVTVFRPDLSISEVNIPERYIVLNNKGDREVNLGGFKLKGPDLSFRFPGDTILSAQSDLYLSFSTLWVLDDLVILDVSNVSIEYPEGGVVKKSN